jgi:phospholipid-binding lipoprotein MlaA
MKMTSWSTIKCAGLFGAALILTGCSTIPQTDPDAPPPLRKHEKQEGREYLIEVSDGAEGFNRRVYNFNAHFDKYVFLPVVRTYRFIMPDYGEDRVSDFYNNLREFGNFYNNLLQLKFKETGTTVSRFGINTTVGVLGLWDRATQWGIEVKREDLGQTFGHYGAGKGSYLVLPVAGPSNVRDGIGLGGDLLITSQLGPPAWIRDYEGVYWTVAVLGPVDQRKRVEFRYFETGSPFEYELVRMAFDMKRDMDVQR